MGEIQKYQDDSQNEENAYEMIDAEIAKDSQLANNLEKAIQNDPKVASELRLAAYNQQKQLELIAKLRESGDNGNVIINNNFYINNSVNNSHNSTDNSRRSYQSKRYRVGMNENETVVALIYILLVTALIAALAELSGVGNGGTKTEQNRGNVEQTEPAESESE